MDCAERTESARAGSSVARFPAPKILQISGKDKEDAKPASGRHGRGGEDSAARGKPGTNTECWFTCMHSWMDSSYKGLVANFGSGTFRTFELCSAGGL